MTTTISRGRLGRDTDMFLRAKQNESLTLDEMRASLPAIFAAEAHTSRSDRYVYIPTHEMLDNLIARDFVPVEARVSRTRNPDRNGYQKHMIRLRHRGDLAGANTTGRKVGDTSFEVIMRNAHDGTGSYAFMAGLLRLICLNGMVASDGEVANVKVLHTGNRARQLDAVADGAYRVLEQGPRVIETVKRWQSIELTRDEQGVFADSAHLIRFGDAEGKVNTPITAPQLLIARRPDDQGDNLWKVFNRVQENAIRGGLTGMGRDSHNRPRRSTSREVRGIDGDVKLNKALWELASKMAALKAA